MHTYNEDRTHLRWFPLMCRHTHTHVRMYTHCRYCCIHMRVYLHLYNLSRIPNNKRIQNLFLRLHHHHHHRHHQWSMEQHLLLRNYTCFPFLQSSHPRHWEASTEDKPADCNALWAAPPLLTLNKSCSNYTDQRKFGWETSELRSFENEKRYSGVESKNRVKYRIEKRRVEYRVEYTRNWKE